MIRSFKKCKVQYIRRIQKKKADALSKLASLTFANLSKKVLVEELAEKLIYENQVTDIVTEDGDSWIKSPHEKSESRL